MASRTWQAGVLVLAMAGYAAAGDITNGVFSAKEHATLSVRYAGKLLIADDGINYLDSLETAAEVVAGKKGGAPVLNVIQKTHDAVQFRKEVALHEDGRMELTVRMRLLPYKNTAKKETLTYSFRIPAQRLDAARFKALAGRIYGPKTVEGTFSARAKDGDIVGDRCRFIAFTGDDVRIVIDCDPYGLMSSGDYCRYGEPVGAWRVAKEGDYVVFSFGQSARFYGGIFSGKVLLYTGEYDHPEKHFYQKWSYHGPTPALAQFTFGTSAQTKGFQKADRAAYDAKQRWGWESPAGLAALDTGSPDVVDNCVWAADGKERMFKLDVTPGHYMVTVRAGHNTKDIGPFDVRLNGRPCAKGVRVDAGETRTLVLPGRVRHPDGELRIAFRGTAPWAVRSIVVQPILYRNEDYTFDRGLWVVDGLFSPEID